MNHSGVWFLLGRGLLGTVGCWSAGDANVLSTQRRQLFAFAIFAIASISETFRVGFVGVSIQINFVFGVIALKTFSAFVVSTKFTVIPNF